MRTALLATFLASALAIAGAAPALAADGELDATFGTDAEFPGFGFYLNPYGSALDANADALRQAPNGQLYLLGSVYDTPTTQRVSLRRLDADGYPDFDFGDSGMRTYPRPCGSGYVADAQIDAQGRLWVGFGGCPDFTIYRFLPNGDPDTSLLGSGVLTIAFDLGDDNVDTVRDIALTPAGGIVVAGWANAAPNRRLAIAHYTGDGQPQPGFGVNGKVDLLAHELFNYVEGLHVMADGRIVVTGRYAPNPFEPKQSVMRLYASGAPDFSFGNHSPGLSHVDLGTLLGSPDKRMTSASSLLLADGSIIQVGSGRYGGAHSVGDFALLKWRADGQLDTTIGPFGLRSYSLDFAGPAPSDDNYNSDHVETILRQGNGQFLLIGRSRGGDGLTGLSVVRLTRSFDVDTAFGSGGKIRHLSNIAADNLDCTHTTDALLQPGRIVAGGYACAGSGLQIQATIGLGNDLLFADAFD